MTLTGCTDCPNPKNSFLRITPFIPARTTPAEGAATTTGVNVQVKQPDGTYSEVQLSSTQPYGVIGSSNALAGIQAEGTQAFLASSAGPAGVGRPSQPVAMGDFIGDGTLGAAYVPVASSPNYVIVTFATKQLTYGSSKSYTVGANAQGVIAADFNGDGKTDLAVAFSGDGTNPGGVAILLSNGTGTFAAPVTYPAGTSPISLAALDLNHDGKLDLAVADNGASPGKVYILLGKGDGTFQPAVNYPVGRNPLSVTVADFDGDGNPDLAVTAHDNSLSILLGNNDGTFRSGSSYATGSNPMYVAAGDFNKDGKMDLAVANAGAQTVSVFMGNGNGTFRAGASYAVSYEPQSLVITDYNGDGNLDIIQGSGDARCIGPGVQNSTIDFLLGNGDGTFQGAVSTIVPGSQGSVGSFAATGDFNGDGKTDVIVNDEYGGNLYLFPGDGQGGFLAPVTIAALAGGTQTGPAGAAVGDFNGDGRMDLAVTESLTGQIAVLLNSASGLQLSGTFPAGGTIPGAIVAADFNGDGKLDLAVANAAIQYPFTPGNLTVFFGDGHGGFTLSHTYSAGNWPRGLAVADLNGDGKPDLVVTDYGGDPNVTPRPAGAVYIFLNDGHGGFQTPTTVTVGAYPSVVSIGDLNGDGKPDLVVGAENADVSYTLSVLLGIGNGTFQPPVSVSTQYGPSGVAIGDFNGDGNADLMVSHCCGATYMTYMQGNGNGTFQQEAAFNSAANSFAVATADLNGDGKPDLIVGGTQPLSVTTFLNNGAAPALGITKTHTGNFSAGQSGATYSVVVSNAGTGPTSGTVTVTDTPPSGETLVSMAGTGWSCSINSCNRSDALNAGASYPPITVTVNVAPGAPSQVTNQVSVSGGGAALASASDPTTILQVPAAPTLVSPANGAAGVLLAPTLTWNAAAGATSYDVYFGTLSSPPLVTNTTSTSYSPGTLSLDATYYWQIVARNSSGSASSATWSFSTGAALAPLRFVPVTPCRVADTRNASGLFGGPTMTAGQTRSFAIPSSGCGIPATAQAYSLNVTVVPEGPLGFLSLWPTGQAQPGVSTLNSWGGAVVANAAIVPAGTGGAVSVFVSNPTDVILDINGYFDSTGSAFYPATPCRVADTRNSTGQFGGPSMFGGQTRDFPIPLSSCGIPSVASAYAMNVTVVPSGPLGYLSTWQTGQSPPNVSTLNSWTGKVVANAAIVPAGTNESISVFVSNPTDVILDINGYFGPSVGAGALNFYPVTPCRVADTRNANGPFGGPEMAAGATRSFAIPASACYVPSTAAAYSLNVTVVPDGPLGYLSAWQAGVAPPYVSTLNSWDGSVVANAAIVPAGTNGAISVFVSNSTHVIVDINGYFAP